MRHIHNVPIQCTGRFKAIVHTGHTFDDNGNVIAFGKVLRETALGRNKITLTGFNYLMANASATIKMVAGTGNTTPAETDTTLVAFQGYSGTHASTTVTRNTTPDVDGLVWWRCTYRVTFNPTTLGSGTKNIAEAGIFMSGGTPISSSPIGARGLLVDGGGSPTTVSLDATTEYLDLIWEYTEYVPASATGTVTLNIDGVDVVHDYEVRPVWFDNVGGSYNYRGWAAVGALSLPGLNLIIAASGYPYQATTIAYTGPLAAITGADPTGTKTSSNVPVGGGWATYTANSKLRDLTLTWTPLYGNINIGAVRVNMGHADWQVSYDPVIAKVNTKQLDLVFRYTMANKP